MIKRLYTLFPNKSVILRLTVLNVILALLQGILLAMLVPILHCLLEPQPDYSSITIWLTTGGIAFLCYLILTAISSPVGFSASMKLAEQLRNDIMSRVTQFPLGWFTADKKARLARNITADVGLISQLAVTIGAPAIVAIIVPVAIIIVAFFISWKIGVLLLVCMPIALLVLRWIARIAAEEDVKLDKEATKIAGQAIELGQAQTVLRAAGKSVEGTAALQGALERHRIVYRKGLRRATLPYLGFTGTLTVGFVAVLFLTTYLFLEQSFSVPEAIVLFILAVRFIEPLGHFTELIGALEAMDNAMKRVQQLLQTPTLPMPERPVNDIKSASVQAENIAFAYGENPVIENVSFHCPPGSATALIGASGSGKTTLVRLIARFYDVHKGAIKIGGTDIRKLDYNTMMNDIAIIFQDVYLFDITIKENLLIAKPDATESELKEAAAAAQLTEMLERLPDGWDTKTGESGLQLSGGERQRVSIARAFLKKARMILIDEAASALDPENERAISKAIANISHDKNRTVIIIAHRPVTIQSANQVIVLDKGKVIEMGSPQDLLKQNGHYAKFIQQYQQRKEWKVEG
ncbi:ABC transporter ATP-binding protein [Haoranjiania flava]|uniref:ABC transporter ATP-binding protein/permease n=1 Tax=Haoranjiania flava TaxID=1856322 RepID=A0AAE3INH6_9BACT|nr:ABC transporter ATP-binding protein [Haoranjiania flava]MCU7692912.1 ABC transporter ATP-binding protein/permease [Haoranjiania flava]